jgi:hypothetical protein
MSDPVRGAFRDVLLLSFFLGLAACGGGGGDSAPATPPSNVFIADSGFSAIASLVTRDPGVGVLTIDRIIQGPNTSLPLAPCVAPNCIRNMALDATNDHLYVSDGFLRVFHGAGTATGDIAPNRLITAHNKAGVFRNALFLHLDAPNNTLYASDEFSGVNVFTSISTAGTCNGCPGSPDVNAARTITTNLSASWRTFGLALDIARNKLYLAGRLDSNSAAAVHVFDNQSTLDGGPYAPDRTIELGTVSALSIFLDAANDRLYVTDAGNQIRVYDSASTAASPAAMPSRTILLPYADSDHLKVHVDVSRDRLYAAGANKGFILNGASTANGAVTVTVLTFSPSTIQFSAVAVRP